MAPDPEIVARLRAAVERGRVARHRYFESIALPDEQLQGPAATEAQVEALELTLKRRLPQSYRCFLLIYGQWRMVDGGVDLLPIDELLRGPTCERHKLWQVKEAAAGDPVAGRALIIGASSVTATKYLLDPATQRVDGEWPLIQYHHGVEAEIPSFIEWLEQSVSEYEELASDPE